MTSTERKSSTSSLLLLSAYDSEEITRTNLGLGSFYRKLLERAASPLDGQGAFLDIVVVCSLFPARHGVFDAAVFDKAQRILVSLYSEISALLRQLGKEDLIDIRIVFAFPDVGKDLPVGSVDAVCTSKTRWPFGPVLPLSSIMKSGRNWGNITVAGTESSIARLQAFLASLGMPQLQYDSDISERVAQDNGGNLNEEPGNTMGYHSIVAVGGTFDHLHAGHKVLLTMTAFTIQRQGPTQVRRLIIGLTGPALLKSKKHAEELSSWETRATETFAFLKNILVFDEENTTVNTTKSPSIASTPQTATTPATKTIVLSWNKSDSPAAYSLVIEIVEINDPFGPTITNKDITALVVSEETASGAKLINEKRREKGWKELEIKVVDVITEGSSSEKMSSTEARRRKAESRKT